MRHVLLLVFAVLAVFLFYPSPSKQFASGSGVNKDMLPYLRPLDPGGLSSSESYFIRTLSKYPKATQFAIVTSFLPDGGLSDAELDFLLRAEGSGIVEPIFLLPEVYDGVGSHELEYLSLVEKVKQKDPDAARYMLETGLFFSDGRVSQQEMDYVDSAITQHIDLMRLFVSRTSFYDKIASADAPSLRASAIFGYLYNDLYLIPVNETASTVQARKKFADMVKASESDYQLKKAFMLIDEYGTPPQDFFNYSVPNYNTQLAVLMGLLEDANVPPDYYLVAAAIAIDYGSVYTVGTDEARAAMRSYVADTFNYVVDTDKTLKENGLGWQASSYPLEADLSIVWGAAGALRRIGNETDNQTATFWAGSGADAGGNASGNWYAVFNANKLSSYEFERYFVTIENLNDMRGFMFDKGFVDASVFDLQLHYLRDYLISSFVYPRNYGSGLDKTVAYLEEYIYANGGHTDLELKEFNRKFGALYTATPNARWAFFKEHSRFFGGICYDDALIEQVMLKSINRGSVLGVLSVHFSSLEAGDLSRTMQTFILYYEPEGGVWRASYNQLFGNIHGNIDSLTATSFLDTRYSFVPKGIPHKYGYVSVPWSNFYGRQIWYDFYAYSGRPPIFHTRYSIGFPMGYMFRELPFVESAPHVSSATVQA